VSPHVNTGVEFMGGHATSILSRSHVGLDLARNGTGAQVSLGLGVTFGLGELLVSDPRALDGTLSIGFADYGPEAQLGVRWVDGGIVDTRLFASFAMLHTRLDSRLMLDSVEGIGGTTGMRAAIGMNWGDALVRAAIENNHDSRDDESWLAFLLPQQVELGWERAGGGDRVGVTLAWGI
jgi:hypothetical protein